MEDTPKKRAQSIDPTKPNPFQKKPKLDQVEDFLLNDDIFAELSIDEDTAEELSKLLSDTSPSCPSPCPVKFVSYPYLAPPVEYSTTSYVTINCNEESCGSSFSDTDSSVMASFDTGGSNIVDPLSLLPTACGDVGDVARGNAGWDWFEVLFADGVEVDKDIDKGLFGFDLINWSC